MLPRTVALDEAGGRTGFARWWTELVADLADHLPGGVAGLAVLVLLMAGATVAALYLWPHRHRWRTRDEADEQAPDEPPDAVGQEADDPELPARPPAELRSLADRYATAGRYAEAVRERLRAMVRELVDREVLIHRPGWTVTELAGAAADAEPLLAAPMREAAEVFSALWYGRRPATAAHDVRMRTLAEQVSRVAAEGGRRGTAGSRRARQEASS